MRHKLIVRDPKSMEVIEARGDAAAKIASSEKWAEGLIWCDLEAWAVQDDGTLILTDECGNFAYVPEGRFRVEWWPENADAT